VVLCTGARERFLPFPGWTLPGVVGVGGAQALVKSGMDVRGRTAVVAGSGPLLLAAAAGLAVAGARIVLVAEQATRLQVARYAAGLWRTPGRLGLAASYRRAIGRASYATGHWVQRAEGDTAVERVVVTDGTRETIHACDLLCTGYGLVPETRLAGLLACASDGEALRVDAFQRTTVPGVFAAGEPTGIGGVEMAVVEGQIAGFASGGRMADAAALGRARRAHRAAADRLSSAFALRPALRALPRPDTILCRCEDVRFGAIDPTTEFRSARLHHRLGMGACQGRVCGDALCWLTGWTPETPRPPVVPLPLSALASRADFQSHSTD
jgi:NADPH-dependent 2,4-dienoyl-CoA reductase/sulfur reductase-like enzyme